MKSFAILRIEFVIDRKSKNYQKVLNFCHELKKIQSNNLIHIFFFQHRKDSRVNNIKEKTYDTKKEKVASL